MHPKHPPLTDTTSPLVLNPIDNIHKSWHVTNNSPNLTLAEQIKINLFLLVTRSYFSYQSHIPGIIPQDYKENLRGALSYLNLDIENLGLNNPSDVKKNILNVAQQPDLILEIVTQPEILSPVSQPAIVKEVGFANLLSSEKKDIVNFLFDHLQDIQQMVLHCLNIQQNINELFNDPQKAIKTLTQHFNQATTKPDQEFSSITFLPKIQQLLKNYAALKIEDALNKYFDPIAYSKKQLHKSLFSIPSKFIPQLKTHLKIYILLALHRTSKKQAQNIATANQKLLGAQAKFSPEQTSKADIIENALLRNIIIELFDRKCAIANEDEAIEPVPNAEPTATNIIAARQLYDNRQSYFDPAALLETTKNQFEDFFQLANPSNQKATKQAFKQLVLQNAEQSNDKYLRSLSIQIPTVRNRIIDNVFNSLNLIDDAVTKAFDYRESIKNQLHTISIPSTLINSTEIIAFLTRSIEESIVSSQQIYSPKIVITLAKMIGESLQSRIELVAKNIVKQRTPSTPKPTTLPTSSQDLPKVRTLGEKLQIMQVIFALQKKQTDGSITPEEHAELTQLKQTHGIK